MPSLAVKYRPKNWEEVVSQNSIVNILKRQVQSNSFKNSYLFCGPSGDGKTTIARIFAREINKGVGNPIEIDAASNSGVDNVRDIISAAKERSLDSEYKIFVIDECHSLSNTAWQAFLKCIEEPPRYTIFIFCTTDVQKVPDTIKNRCQRFNFSRVSSDLICNRLKYICNKEGFVNYDESCDYISKICNGSVRDAISMIEKCSGYSEDLSIKNVLESIGSCSYDEFFDLVNAIVDGKEKEVSYYITRYYNRGADIRIFVDQFISFCLDVAKYCLFNSFDMISIPKSFEQRIKDSTNFDNSDKYYMWVVDKLLDLKNMIKTDINARLTTEVVLLQIARVK